MTVNMAALRLDHYRGRLNAAQIAAGMNAAEDNAARLLADAPECRALSHGSLYCDPLHRGSPEGLDLTPDRRLQGRHRTAEASGTSIDYIAVRTATRTFRACLLRLRTI